MYQEVYIDIVFAANFLMDYILLRLVGIFLKYRTVRCRCMAAAVSGALYSSLSLYVPVMNTAVVARMLSVLCAGVMLWGVYRIRGWKNLVQAGMLFYVLAFLVGGFWERLTQNVKMTGLVFGMCAAGSYGVLSLLSLWHGTGAGRKNVYPVTLKYRGREKQIYGLYDTGNLLVDPCSGAPVSFADPEVLRELLTEEILEKLKNLKKNPEALKSTEITDLRPHYLFYRTVGQGERSILAVTLDDLCIQIPGNRIHISDPILALSFEPFALGKEYKVLLNSRLLH